MGRFYKTAKPEMVDFMYQVPEQAILSAIKGTDASIEEQEKFLTDFQKQLKHQALTPDVERQKELLKQYEDQIKERALKLHTNPLEALKERQKTRELGNKLYEDITRGELAAQYGNYAARQKHLEEETKRATDKDGTIRYEDLTRAMAEFDRRYAAEKKDETTGEIIEKAGLNYDPTTGKYRSYTPEKLVNYYDTQKEFANIAKDWKPSVDSDITTVDMKNIFGGNHYVTTRTGRTILPLNELTKGVFFTGLYDSKLGNYYDQQIEIAGQGDKNRKQQAFNSIYGERVDPLNKFSPFVMEPATDAEGRPVMKQVKTTEDGKEVIKEVPEMVIKNPGSLYQAAQLAASKQDINKTVDETKVELSELDKIRLKSQLDLQNSLALKDDEEKRQYSDVWYSTSEIQTNTFGDVTDWKQFENNRTKAKTNMVDVVANAKLNLGSIIENSNLPKTERDKHIVNLHQLMQKQLELVKENMTPNWTEIQEYIKANNLEGINGVGTGIKNLKSTITTLQTNYNNDNEAYSYAIKKAKDRKYGNTSLTYEEVLQQAQDEKDKAKQEYNESIGDSAKEKKYQEAETKLKSLQLKFSAELNDVMVNSKNTKTITIDNFTNKGLDEKTAAQANKALKAAKSLFPQLTSGPEQLFAIDGKGNPTNFNELVKSGRIDFKDETDEEEGVKHDANKPWYKVVNVSIAPDNLNSVPYSYTDATGKVVQAKKDLGRNALVYTIQIHDPKTNTSQVAQVFVNKNQVGNQKVNEALQILEPYYTANNFANDTKARLEPIKGKDDSEKNKQYQTTVEGVKYYPYAGPGGRWEFPDGKKHQGDEGQNYYATYYAGKNN